MNTLRTTKRSHGRRGQVLPVSIIILAILLVLGFVFLGILNRNLQQGRTGQRRSEAEDLARAAVDFAHKKLLHSESRADYRPPIIQLAGPGIDLTKDPDAYYLRPGTGLGFRTNVDNVVDLGGPDGLGPYSRYLFENGRALVRVSYRPSNANMFDANPTGVLSQPGKARAYTTIEVVGRVGRIDQNDPTTSLNNTSVKFRNYVSWAEYRQNYETMRTRDNSFVTSRKLIAFASIGLLEHALFVTNDDNSSKPSEMGVSPDSGANFNGVAVLPTFTLGNASTGPAGSPIAGGGSVWINGDLRLFGTVQSVLNQGLGDQFIVTGSIVGADPASTLELIRKRFDESVIADDDDIVLVNGTATVNGTPSPGSLDSGDAGFLTFAGLIRDGMELTDVDGWSRWSKRKGAPRFTDVDPVTGWNTYYRITRDGGTLTNNGNSGARGHAPGVYVNNLADRQNGIDQDSREAAGSNQSIVYDVLNPNNNQPGSGWQGAYYVPVGALMRLQWDGFTITRDSRAPANQRTWRTPAGADSGKTSLRFRIGDPDGVGPQPTYIINELSNPVDIEAANPVWTNGYPFNGVVLFEGNVRVRGVIATDVQMTLISMANIYIDGSITKGNVNDATGARINHPSRSALMLMAKDYVLLNTTQFFGISTSNAIEEVNETSDPLAGNSIRMRASGGSLSFVSEFNFRSENVPGLPALNTINPQTWRPYVLDYVDPATSTAIDTKVLFTHAMDDGPAPYAFFGANINFGIGAPTYNFEMDADNSASPPYAAGSWGPIKGLGSQSWQRYPSMESKAYPLVRPATVGFATFILTANEAAREGAYNLFVGHSMNDITIYSTNVGAGASNDLIVRRAAIVPHDIRVEAGIYAEQGSFFVIPGRWFNPNPNDTRQAWTLIPGSVAVKNAQRKSLYGNAPEMPFFGEPLDVKVTILGSVSENMTQPAAVQSEWAKKWGWIPREHGSSGELIPTSHVPAGYNVVAGNDWVPNLTIVQDPVFATGRTTGFVEAPDSFVRFERVSPSPGVFLDYALAPMPRLPVSPTLAYYGEVNP